MADSTPTASAKRKVMGRMDVASSDSPSSTITPTARPRYMRGPHGASSPAFTSGTPSSGSRAATIGTPRARVDMSAFASPTMSNSPYSPGMSPSVSASQNRPTFATASSAGQLGRTSAQSPSLRPGPFAGHTRASSTLGTSSPSITSSDLASSSDLSQSESLNFRSPRVRSKTDDADLTASTRAFTPTSAASPMTASTSARVLTARATPTQAHRASAPHQITRATTSGSTPIAKASARPPMSPQRNSVSTFTSRAQEEPRSSTSSSRTSAPSGALSAPSQPRHHGDDGSLSTVASELRGRDHLFIPKSPSKDRAEIPVQPGGVNSNNVSGPNAERAHTRTQSGFSALQRASLPASLQTVGHAHATEHPPSPLSPTSSTFMRPQVLQQRSSFASSTASSFVPPLLSPGLSDSPAKSAAEVAEAEEARIHRKLLDLEITNKSLLAINSGLEVVKLKQAREIRELKRRLREGGRSQSVDPHAPDASLIDEEESDSGSDASTPDDDDILLLDREDPELEAAHVRCKAMIDNMLAQARKSILSRHEIIEVSTGGKVLHPVEVEQMRREQEGDDQSQQLDQSGVLHPDDETNGDYSAMTFDASADDVPVSELSLSMSPSASSERSSSSTDGLLAEANTSSSTSNVSNDNNLLESVSFAQLLATPKTFAEPLNNFSQATYPPLPTSAPSIPGDVSID